MTRPFEGYHHPSRLRRWIRALHRRTRGTWTLMEVCGGQTHTLLRYGIDQVLPPSVTLLHGPGCPVCVTPPFYIDQAIALSLQPGVLLCTFGDMLRVPGSGETLLQARARGGAVQVVYSPLDVLKLAHTHPEKEVVFFAVGFETTLPATAALVLRAQEAGLSNLSILQAHVRVPPALEQLLQDPAHRIHGFLAPGHVCTVMGYREYEELARRYGVPIVVTGFEPLDLLQGIYLCVCLLEAREVRVLNQYQRCVTREGNRWAQEAIHRVFIPTDRHWRGMGWLPGGGWRFRPAFEHFDALRRFGLEEKEQGVAEPCPADQILRGVLRPEACVHFGTRCTPEQPLGAPMVSSEGACAAYFRYRAFQGGPS